MPKNEDKDDLEDKDLILNNDLPCIHIDGLEIHTREDDFVFIRLISSLPEGPYEQYRFMISDEDCRGLIEAICETIDYYPSNPNRTKPKINKKS